MAAIGEFLPQAKEICRADQDALLQKGFDSSVVAIPMQEAVFSIAHHLQLGIKQPKPIVQTAGNVIRISIPSDAQCSGATMSFTDFSQV